MKRSLTILAAAAQLLSTGATAAPLTDWPQLKPAMAPDAKLEARIREIVAGMTLEQKVGQMTQPEIKFSTPEDIRKYAAKYFTDNNQTIVTLATKQGGDK